MGGVGVGGVGVGGVAGVGGVGVGVGEGFTPGLSIEIEMPPNKNLLSTSPTDSP